MLVREVNAVLGSHSGAYEDGCFLGCYAVWSSSAAASVIRTASTALMMEAAVATETSVNLYQTTRHNNPEDSHLHAFPLENLKYHNCGMWWLNMQPQNLATAAMSWPLM
jgi:hypothetical protein